MSIGKGASLDENVSVTRGAVHRSLAALSPESREVAVDTSEAESNCKEDPDGESSLGVEGA